jgi:pilus assembly protein Flp/PilA
MTEAFRRQKDRERQHTMMKCPKLAIVARIVCFVRDDSGATAIEYAMIASGIGVVIAASVVNLGSTVKGLYSSVATAMK